MICKKTSITSTYRHPISPLIAVHKISLALLYNSKRRYVLSGKSQSVFSAISGDEFWPIFGKLMQNKTKTTHFQRPRVYSQNDEKE